MNAHASARAGAAAASEPGQARESVVFSVAVVLSLVLHAAVALAFYDHNLFEIDPNLLRDRSQPFQVHRAPRDLIVDDVMQVVDPTRVPDAASLSRALLESGEAGAPTPETPTTPVELRTMLGHEALDAADLPGGSGGEGESEAAWQRLTGELHIDLPAADRGADGSRPGAEAVAVGDSGALAADLLISGGLSLRDEPPPPEPPGPMIDTRPATQAIDPVLIESPAARPAIDLATLARLEPDRITIPEHLDDDFDYTVWTYDPRPEGPGTWFNPNPLAEEIAYFRVDITPKRTLRKLKTMPKDVVFIVDTSGSVPQAWIEQVIAAVKDAISTLNEGDRFNVVLFNESPAFFSTDRIVPFNAQALAQVGQFLDRAESQGYTDVNRALSRLLVRDLEAERVYNLVLISDGVPTRGVMNTRDLINIITRDNDLVASIYGIGVGRRQNRQLLEFLAYRNKGFCLFAEQTDDVRPVMRDLMSRLRFPILKDVALSVSGLDADQVFPRTIPDIHQGQTFSIYGRFDRPVTFTMRLIGTDGGRPLDFTFTRDLANARAADRTIARQWAFWKLHHLYSEMIRHGETDRLMQQVRELRHKYDLETVYD